MINIIIVFESRVLFGFMYDKLILFIMYFKIDFEEIKCMYWYKYEIVINNWYYLKLIVLYVFKNVGRMYMLLSCFLKFFIDK